MSHTNSNNCGLPAGFLRLIGVDARIKKKVGNAALRSAIDIIANRHTNNLAAYAESDEGAGLSAWITPTSVSCFGPISVAGLPVAVSLLAGFGLRSITSVQCSLSYCLFDRALNEDRAIMLFVRRPLRSLSHRDLMRFQNCQRLAGCIGILFEDDAFWLRAGPHR